MDDRKHNSFIKNPEPVWIYFNYFVVLEYPAEKRLLVAVNSCSYDLNQNLLLGANLSWPV